MNERAPPSPVYGNLHIGFLDRDENFTLCGTLSEALGRAALSSDRKVVIVELDDKPPYTPTVANVVHPSEENLRRHNDKS